MFVDLTMSRTRNSPFWRTRYKARYLYMDISDISFPLESGYVLLVPLCPLESGYVLLVPLCPISLMSLFPLVFNKLTTHFYKKVTGAHHLFSTASCRMYCWRLPLRSMADSPVCCLGDISQDPGEG